MNEFSQQIISELAAVVPFRYLKSRRKTPVLLPFYHLVSDEDLPWRSNYDYPNTKQFEAELDFLLKHFKPLALDDLLSGKDLSGGFHLSFDDGLRQCAEVIAPMLTRKGIPATFFINPSFIDNKDLFHRYKAAEISALLKEKNIHIHLQRTYADLQSLDDLAEEIGLNWEDWLQQKQPYMSLDQVRQLQADGFTIGSHSMDHPEFELLDAETQLDEIQESMDWLVEHVEPRIRAFAFPFTDFGVPDSVIESCHRENMVDISFGTAGLKREHFPFHFQRLPLENRIETPIRARLKQEYLAYQLKRLLGKHYTRRD